MKDKFPGYFPPSESQQKEIWSRALIVPDANVLLHFCRQDANTVKLITDLFSSLKDRLWVSYQAADEYNRNRTDVISERRRAYTSIIQYLRNFTEKTLPSEFGCFKPHPVLDIDSVISEIKEGLAPVAEKLDERLKGHPDQAYFDQIHSTVGDLFSGRTGESFSKDELDTIYKEGEERYKDTIPPGYRNSKKPGNDKYGDLVVWKEVIRKSKIDNLPIIFITDEKHDDWWREQNGAIIGPRVELVKEFLKEAQQQILMYRFQGFIDAARKYIGNTVPEIAIADVPSHSDQAVIANTASASRRNSQIGQRIRHLKKRANELEFMIAKKENNLLLHLKGKTDEGGNYDLRDDLAGSYYFAELKNMKDRLGSIKRKMARLEMEHEGDVRQNPQDISVEDMEGIA